MTMPTADVLASGIHDAKNRLFEAQMLLAQAERAHNLDLADARGAIAGAATRLSRALTAYRVLHGRLTLAIAPVSIGELIEDALMTLPGAFARACVDLKIAPGYAGLWPLDRTLTTDALANALQNACRHARANVLLEVQALEECLKFRVNDDGPGYPADGTDPGIDTNSGLGLFIARRIAHLHRRKGVSGSLALANGGPLGGALFELALP